MTEIEVTDKGRWVADIAKAVVANGGTWQDGGERRMRGHSMKRIRDLFRRKPVQVVNITINNPSPERAADAVAKVLRRNDGWNA